MSRRMWHRAIRWRSLVVVAVLVIAGWLGSGVVAESADLSDEEVLATLSGEHARDKAIRRGLSFLRTKQNPDGSIGRDHKTALTSLAVMSHLAAGHTLDDPELGPLLRKSLYFVLAGQDEHGYFGRKDGSRMYGHGIAALMLAEALGMTRDDELEEAIRQALEKAVKVTVSAAQRPKSGVHVGGWRYTPQDGTSDLSLSGWQLMSLHATQQVGITVPDTVIDGAVQYAARLTTADGRVGYESPGADHPALRGLSMLCSAIGSGNKPAPVAHVAKRIQDDPIAWKGPWFYYRAYYDAVGMSRAAPDAWIVYGPKLESLLLDHQAADGAWPSPPGDNEAGHGEVYRTSMAILALTVQRHVLPAYQR